MFHLNRTCVLCTSWEPLSFTNSWIGWKLRSLHYILITYDNILKSFSDHCIWYYFRLMASLLLSRCLSHNKLFVNCSKKARSFYTFIKYFSFVTYLCRKKWENDNERRLLLSHSRRTMYFVSSLMTVTSLVGVATFNFLLTHHDLAPEAAPYLKWATLAAAGALVFAVQLGVQTLPTLLSGTFWQPCLLDLKSKYNQTSCIYCFFLYWW